MEAIQTIGSFLLSASVDDDVAVSGEALDAIFDVFGDDDDCGDNMKIVEIEIRLIERLRNLIPGFQEKVSWVNLNNCRELELWHVICIV